MKNLKEKFLPEYNCKSVEEIKEFYSYFYPHETTFKEMRENNPELYCKMKNYEIILKLMNYI